MKSFRDYLKEDVVPTAVVKDGSIDLEREVVRAQINSSLASVLADPSVTPYNALMRASKVLSYFSIILPKRVYLDGEKGIEAIELRQFGDRMGMTDQGEFVKEVPGKFYLFIQYWRTHPNFVPYAATANFISSTGGMFKVAAKVVDKVELDRLIDMAEVSLSEAAEDRQALAKAMAPKEDMHTALGDCDCTQGDSPSTKSAVSVMMRKKDKKLSSGELDEEQLDEVGDTKRGRKTLGDYIKKAHVSGLEAASKGEIAYARKDKAGLHKANKTGEKREQGINRAADRLSMEEEYEKVEAGVKKRPGETHTLHRRNPGHKTEYHTITTDRDGRKSVKTGSPKYIKKHWDKLEEEQIDELWEPITGSRKDVGSNRRKRKAVQMALGRKHKGEEGWNDRTNLQHSSLTMGRKLQKQGVVKEDNLDEAMGSVKKSYAMKKMKKKVSTQVKQGLGIGKERTNTVLVTNKGDPSAAGGGGVHRIPRDKYDPTKHNLASE
jgi:hypothetical protein